MFLIRPFRKGVSLSFNTIVIAIITLTVLAIVIYLLLSNVGHFDDDLACTHLGGHCVSVSADCDNVLSSSDGSDLCPTAKPVCCGLVPEIT